MCTKHLVTTRPHVNTIMEHNMATYKHVSKINNFQMKRFSLHLRTAKSYEQIHQIRLELLNLENITNEKNNAPMLIQHIKLLMHNNLKNKAINVSPRFI